MTRAGRIPMLGLVLLCAAGVTAASGRSETPAPRSVGAQEVEVVGLVVNPETHEPTVVLQGKRDKRTFAMVIGLAEATGIALPLRNLTPPRPLTHDLFLTLFGRLHVTVSRAVVTDLRDGVYYATILLSADGREIELDARPSDAIALAVRARVPVLVEDRVFEKSERLAPERSAPRI